MDGVEGASGGGRAVRNAGGLSALETRALFTAVAARYDLLNHLLSFGLDLIWRRRAAGLARCLGTGDLIVDLCTGTGDQALALSRAAPGAMVVGFDFNVPMLALAVRKRDRSKDRRVFFGLADALALPLADGVAALAVISFGLRNLSDPAAGLAEMARVTRPGGRVAVLEFTRPQGRLFGHLYQGYLNRFLPFLAARLAPGATAAYDYLPRSIQAFPGPAEIGREMEKTGLVDLDARPLAWGTVHLLSGQKP
jgi:demethylmenaquinone methyltransferase/2-methoxy-6-polyprenyl-1,4-benzoquinol methylase